MEKSNMTLAPETIFSEDTGKMHQWDFTENKSAILKNSMKTELLLLFNRQIYKAYSGNQEAEKSVLLVWIER